MEENEDFPIPNYPKGMPSNYEHPAIVGESTTEIINSIDFYAKAKASKDFNPPRIERVNINKNADGTVTAFDNLGNEWKVSPDWHVQ